MRYKYLGLVFILFSGQPLADTLLDATRNAGATNSEIQAAIYQQLAMSEKSWQGLSGLLPTLQLNGSYSEQNQPKASYEAKVKRHDASIVISQPLFDLTKYADYLRGNTMKSGGEVELLITQQKLINEVVESYGRVLYLRDVLHAARIASKAYQEQLDHSKVAMRIGEATRIDVDEAQANLDVSQAKEIETENELLTAGAHYNRLTGLKYEQIEPITAQCLAAKKSFQTLPEKTILNKVLATNYDIRLAQLELELANNDVFATTSAHLPVVNLQASYGNNWSRGEGDNPLDSLFGTTSKTTSTNIGVTVSVPIFNGGMLLSQSREAAYKKEQARYQLIDTRRRIKEELHTAILNIHNTEALLFSTQRVIKSEKSKVASTSLGKTMGIRTQIDELNAQQRYYDAIRSNAEARFKLLNAKVGLARLMGELGYGVLSEITCSS